MLRLGVVFYWAYWPKTRLCSNLADIYTYYNLTPVVDIVTDSGCLAFLIVTALPFLWKRICLHLSSRKDRCDEIFQVIMHRDEAALDTVQPASVTNMDRLNCKDGLNVEHVTTMVHSAKRSSGNVSGLDMPNVTVVWVTINLDFNTTNVTSMLDYAKQFSGDISGLQMANVTNTTDMCHAEWLEGMLSCDGRLLPLKGTPDSVPVESKQMATRASESSCTMVVIRLDDKQTQGVRCALLWVDNMVLTDLLFPRILHLERWISSTRTTFKQLRHLFGLDDRSSNRSSNRLKIESTVVEP